jgi:hypothetical protein
LWSDPQARGARGVVVALLPGGAGQLSEHERCTLLGFARELAALRGEDLAGFHGRGSSYPGHVYFVPHGTLRADEASELGIAGPDDLFGGVVPHAFIATKAISHPLVDPAAPAPAGWNPRFGWEIADCVLRGYTAFCVPDARAAGRQLLARGPVRLKPVRASGSRGQSVVHDGVELLHALHRMDGEEIATHGLVLEENLQELRTLSIGQVHAAGLTASYFGRQRATRNNRGLVVYGGSDLTLVRGGYDALLALQPAPEVVHALRQARRYDAAVRACYPGFYASRCNYDVILGRDASGATQAAVLEQSWRAGGGTGPELAGLQRLQAEPRRHVVRAASVEAFGHSPEPPPGATVYYRGTDPHVGPMTKYTIVDPA